MITINELIPGEIIEFEIQGDANVEEINNIVKNQYGEISECVIWNLNHGSIANLNSDDLKRIARTVAKHAVHKKTAYVGSEKLQFGLLRMYEIYAELEEVAPEMKVFQDRDEAIQWLRE